MSQLKNAVLAALLVIAGSQVAVAQEDGPLVVSARNVTAQEAGRASQDALPGDVVRYELRFTNSTPAAVRNVVFDNPIPSGMRYEAASARSDYRGAVVTYSIDGGRTYSAQPMIEQVVNGERRTVAAPAEMYTHVRWTLAGTVRSGAQVVAEFQARVAPAGAVSVF
jgi:uncharacterized repeat protein (TIGR01451 family)